MILLNSLSINIHQVYYYKVTLDQILVVEVKHNSLYLSDLQTCHWRESFLSLIKKGKHLLMKKN